MSRILLIAVLVAGCQSDPSALARVFSPAQAVSLARTEVPNVTRHLATVTSSKATGTRPAPTEAPRSRSSLRGIATWFRSPAGVSAAGRDLREEIGPGWRQMRVRVCAGDRCLYTVLGDWMAADKLIDLHAPLFAKLAPLGRGILPVTVSW